MTGSFLLYNKEGFTKYLVFLRHTNKYWNLLANKTIDRHISVPSFMVGVQHSQ